MRPRFVGRLGPADAVTLLNAMLGFVAAAAATVDPALAARVVLLAAMGDGLDGVVARRFGGTTVGPYLDSLADVAAFGVAPALMVFSMAAGEGALAAPTGAVGTLAVAVGAPAVFLATVVVRLGFYIAEDTDRDRTEGVPSTLAATVLAAAVLAGVVDAAVVLAGTAVMAGLMVFPIDYPDLLTRDVALMGTVQGLAVAVPSAFGRAFPYALLVLSFAYLVLGPRFYWRPGE